MIEEDKVSVDFLVYFQHYHLFLIIQMRRLHPDRLDAPCWFLHKYIRSSSILEAGKDHTFCGVDNIGYLTEHSKQLRVYYFHLIGVATDLERARHLLKVT